MAPFLNAFDGKTVLVTGHTGFKGSWLTLWLRQLGATVVGYALNPPTQPSLFEIANVSDGIIDVRADIRNRSKLQQVFFEHQPDVVIHMAAQPLVRLSYDEPTETLETNVMGTANVLECVKKTEGTCAVVVVTSDKCYENVSSYFGYREIDPMGGSDPYSMSKGVAELVTSSWRRSFFKEGPVRVASARAGNVIGGGDWAKDRITTDCVKALCEGRAISIRNPHATRPWQHVLEPLSGYLWLAAKLLADDGHRFASAWNFGPSVKSVCSVEAFSKILIRHWGGGDYEIVNQVDAPHEAKILSLTWEKAYHLLGWEPTWSLDTCLKKTSDWYKAWHSSHGSPDGNLRDLTLAQINEFQNAAALMENGWVQRFDEEE